MKVEIKEQNKVPLLQRTEVVARITFEGPTPSKDDVTTALAKTVKADTSLMVVNNIDTDFGTAGASVKAHVYDSKEALEAYRPKMGKKGLEKIEAEKKKAEEAKAAPKEEKPEAKAEAPAEPEKKEEAETKEEAPTEPEKKEKAETKKEESKEKEEGK